MIAPGTIHIAIDPRHIAHNPELADCNRVAELVTRMKSSGEVQEGRPKKVRYACAS